MQSTHTGGLRTWGMGCREGLAPLLKHGRKLSYKIPKIVAQEQAHTVNGGGYFLRAFGGLLLFVEGPWMVAWMVALASRRLWGTMELCMPRGLHLKKRRRTFAHRSITWHTFVVPHFAVPGVACSRFSPPPVRWQMAMPPCKCPTPPPTPFLAPAPAPGPGLGRHLCLLPVALRRCSAPQRTVQKLGAAESNMQVQLRGNRDRPHRQRVGCSSGVCIQEDGQRPGGPARRAGVPEVRTPGHYLQGRGGPGSNPRWSFGGA